MAGSSLPPIMPTGFGQTEPHQLKKLGPRGITPMAVRSSGGGGLEGGSHKAGHGVGCLVFPPSFSAFQSQL